MTRNDFELIEARVLQWLPGALLVVDATGRIVQANALAEQLFGYAPETLAGQPLENLIPARLRSRHRHHLSAYFHNPSLRPMGSGLELDGLRQDGSEFPVAIKLGPIPGPGGALAAAAVQDLTADKHAQQALERAAVALAQQLQTRDSELSQAHTELRRQIAGRLQAEDALRKTEISYRQLVETQPDLICRFLPDTTLTFVNTAYARFFGCRPEELIGRRFIELIAAAERPAIQAYLAAFIPAEPARQYEHGALRAGGVCRWHLWHDFAFFDEQGKITDFQAVGIDITERKQAEEALAAEKERAQVTLHSIGDAVITTDAQGKVEYLNPVAETLTGWTAAEAQGRPLREVFQIIEEASRQPAPDPVARCLREGRIVGLANHSVLISRSGKEYDIDDSAAPILGRDGRLLGAVLVFHDVTETRRLAQQMRYDATHDALTGLVNRREFERRLERALASAKQYGVKHALCYLDLDRFKLVNDTAGHAAGDELLKQIKGLLLGSFRDRDTLARLGGDEFGLLLDNCPLDRAWLIAQTLISTIREYRFAWRDRVFQIGMSIGLAPVTAAAADATQLLAQADIACYTAKQLGRNQVHLYQQADSESTRRYSGILHATQLRDALEQGRFRLYCQPIVPLATGGNAAMRYELLLRLVADTGEILLPAAFIPPAERYGLMGAIDRWVIQTAFRRYTEEPGISEAGIHLNLSGNSLSDPTFTDFVQAQLAGLALPPQQICFEIGETDAIHNLRQATGFMMAMKGRGCQIALDQFGRELSSFFYLKTLPVDYLKIDSGFVKNMLDDPRDHAMVVALNQLGHTLGIQTIAEHAGNQAIVERLRALGMDYAQGYALGRPRPWVEIRSPAG